MRALLACLLLTGCVHGQTVPAVVKVPVAVSCLPDVLPAKPAVLPNSDLAKLGDGELVRAVRTLAILNVRLAQMIQAVLVLAVKP